MNYFLKTLIYISFLSIPAFVFCEDKKISSDDSFAEVTQQEISATEKEKVEAHIKRIEEKLKSEPKVEGWVLVGDANMHLKKYEAAARAYQEAYILSEYSRETRNKLKRALYFVNSGIEEIE
ncbi:MAG TPA: hypothetical protein EYQ42_07355 [Thiotrichaceae bacterium]|jgi:cytochrome c-type biogenesis protein CcmH/NrfG|nr:hypothetical protein [Thiotrichaceae bacterium]HIM07994.1 hypothetical protein [Gammaproteobacteria bacterium]